MYGELDERLKVSGEFRHVRHFLASVDGPSGPRISPAVWDAPLRNGLQLVFNRGVLTTGECCLPSLDVLSRKVAQFRWLFLNTRETAHSRFSARPI
jgi:hypothetical protein